MHETLICFLFLASVTFTGYGGLWLIDRRRVCDPLEQFVLSFPSGLAAVGAVLYTLNVLGLSFERPLVVGALAGGTLLGLAAIVSSRRAIADRVKRRGRPAFRPGLAGTICLIVALCVILGFMARDLTEVNHLQDTELYHFPYAAIVFRTHHQPVFASQSISEEFSFPAALFVSYAALWTCLGHINQLVPNLFPVPIIVSWALLSILAVRRVLRGSDGAAAFACLLLVSTYELEIMAAGESADLLPVVLGSGAAYWLARDVGEGGNRRLFLAAWLLGLNCWVKYQGIPFAACAALALIVSRVTRHREKFSAAASAEWLESSGADLCIDGQRSRPRWNGWITAAVLFAAALLIMLPFLLRNLFVFGSPIYPGALGPFHGMYSSPWCVRIVGGYWQPKLFYRFPDILARAIREPAVLLGAPALLLAYRRQHQPAIFLGWMALLYVCLFLVAMNSSFPSGLRFAGASLAILSWLGGWLAVEMERLPDSTLRPVMAILGGLVFTAAVIALFDSVLRQSGTSGGSVVNIWWIVPFALGLFVLSRPQVKSSSPGMVGYWVALVVGVVVLLHQQPFLDFRNIGRDLGRVDWSVVPPASDVVGWMQKNVPQRANSTPVTYTYYTARWALPGALLPGDDPLLEPIHQPGVSVPAALETLRQLGAQYVLEWKATPLDNYQPFRTDPVIKNLQDIRYFKLLRHDNISALYRILYPDGKQALAPDASRPMPWLLFAASGPQAHG